MGLRAALWGLVDRALSRLFGSSEPESSISLEEALDIYEGAFQEAEELNEQMRGEVPQEPAAEPEVVTAIAIPYPRTYYQYALTQLTLNGVYRPHQLIKWEANGWKDVPADAWAEAAVYLDTHPQFLAALRNDTNQGWSWDVFTPPAVQPSEYERQVLLPKRGLSRKKIDALPRPRPKDQNPVYKTGAKPPVVWTLDTDFSQIEKLLASTQLDQAESAREALKVAEHQKVQLQDWFQRRMAQQEEKIHLLQSSVDSWSNPGPTHREPKTPKRDAKGRFIKG